MSVGEKVTVVLASTYWQFDPNVDPAVLQWVGEPTYERGQCELGAGCGTATAVFDAVGSGSTVIHATRSSCGEAMACGPDEASFSVTVTVR